MDVVLISALCICACIMVKLLQRDAAEFSFLIILSVTAIITALAVADISDIADTIDSLFTKINLNEDYSSILFKSVGVCVLASVAADLCRDCGENALASGVSLFCRVTLLVLSMPLYSRVISLVDQMLG